LHIQGLGQSASQRVLTVNGEITSASWTLDGQSLLFAGVHERRRGIWQVPVSGGEPRLLHGTTSAPFDITLSAQGRLGAFTEERARRDLWLVSLKDAFAAKPLVTSGLIHDSPRFSPDGKRLAFFRAGNGRPEVWLCTAAGGDLHPLTPGIYPAWSPDGRRVAFCNSGISVIAADGGPTVALTRESGIDTWPVWSNDAESIYFESNRAGTLNIWKVGTRGGGVSPVQVTRSGARKPAIHEDFLYYWKANTGIRRVPLAGVSDESFCEDGIAFQPMPGGCYLLQRDHWRLIQVDYRTRATRVVAELPNAATGSALAISPNEQSVVYARETHPGHEILLVRDWPA
jgi:Tol biopolymer transport system component